MWPAASFAHWQFQQTRAKRSSLAARATASCRSTKMFTAALGVIFSIAGHVEPWPVAAGGSQSIPRALAAFFASSVARVRTGVQ